MDKDILASFLPGWLLGWWGHGGTACTVFLEEGGLIISFIDDGTFTEERTMFTVPVMIVCLNDRLNTTCSDCSDRADCLYSRRSLSPSRIEQ